MDDDHLVHSRSTRMRVGKASLKTFTCQRQVSLDKLGVLACAYLRVSKSPDPSNKPLLLIHRVRLKRPTSHHPNSETSNRLGYFRDVPIAA